MKYVTCMWSENKVTASREETRGIGHSEYEAEGLSTQPPRLNRLRGHQALLFFESGRDSVTKLPCDSLERRFQQDKPSQ